MKIKNPLADHLHFTKGERRGALLLICLAIGLFLFPKLHGLFRPPAPLLDNGEFAEALSRLTLPASTLEAELFAFDPNTLSLDSLLLLGLPERTARSIVNYRSKGGKFRTADDMKKIYTLRTEDFERLERYVVISGQSTWEPRERPGYADKSWTDKPKGELFVFDPNSASEQELMRLGLPARVAKAIINYRSKGGKFRKPEDLQKIYSLSPADYTRVAPYIQIQAAPTASAPSGGPIADAGLPRSYDAPRTRSVIIDINAATAEEWQLLPGIGPYYARRIVAFREALGGFATVEQVAETRGLPDSTFQRVMLSLRPSAILRGLPINLGSAEELQRHPYLSRKAAEVLVRYREQHGPFQKPEDLLRTVLLHPDDVERLKPYLVF